MENLGNQFLSMTAGDRIARFIMDPIRSVTHAAVIRCIDLCRFWQRLVQIHRQRLLPLLYIPSELHGPQETYAFKEHRSDTSINQCLPRFVSVVMDMRRWSDYIEAHYSLLRHDHVQHRYFPVSDLFHPIEPMHTYQQSSGHHGLFSKTL